MQSTHRARYEADLADRAARLRSVLTREAKRDARRAALASEDLELLQRHQAMTARLEYLREQMPICRRVDPVVVMRYAAYQRLGYEPPMPKPVDRHAELQAEYKRLRAAQKELKRECADHRQLDKYLDYCRRIDSDRRRLESDDEILGLMREILAQQEALEALKNDCAWMAAVADQ